LNEKIGLDEGRTKAEVKIFSEIGWREVVESDSC
jgi:hypothetical protein